MKKLLKPLLWVLVLTVSFSMALTFSLAGCKAAAEEEAVVAEEVKEEAPEEPVVEEEKVIGLSMPDLQAPYWKVWIEGFEKACNNVGYDYITADAQGNVDQQINQIEDLYNKGVDALVIVPLDAKAIVPVINTVYEESGKAFPMITGNVMTDPAELESLVGYAGPNSYLEAGLLAEAFINLLEENGVDKISGVMITGEPGYSDTIDREMGFVEKIDEIGWKDKITWLDKQPGNWMMDEAQKIMENYITAYGDQIEFVYAHDGTMIYGAWLALEEAGYEPGKLMLMAINGQKEEIELIQKGIQTFSINQAPSADSAKAIEVLQKIFRGEDVEYYNFIDTPVITKDNVEEFKPGEF